MAAPPIVFAVVLGLVAILAAAELYDLRAAGLWAAIEAVVLALGIGALSFLRFVQDPPSWLLAAIVSVWAGDVVAYVVGTTIGRRKILPRISPGKTWEGTLAGFVAATAAAILVAIPAGLASWWVVTAVLIGPVAFGGDLLELPCRLRRLHLRPQLQPHWLCVSSGAILHPGVRLLLTVGKAA